MRPTLDVVAMAGAIAVLAYALVGLGAAALGLFWPLPVLVATALVTALAWWWVLPHVRAGSGATRPHRGLLATVVVVCIASGVWNGANHGEHLIAERDPGMYTAAALSLNNTGQLRIAKPSGAFRGSDAVQIMQNGFDDVADDSYDSWWPDLNAVFLAGAAWGGYDLLFLVPAVLSSLALLWLFLLGCRLGSPGAGAFATVALAVSYPFVYVARDQFSEPLAMVLLLAGLWALTHLPSGGRRVAAVVGALLGATCLARIDGLVPMMPLAGVLVLQTTLARRQGRKRHAETYAAALTALVVVAFAGILETRLFAQGYFITRLAPRLPILIAGALLGAVAGRLLGSAGYRVVDGRLATTTTVRRAAITGAVAIAGIVAWLRFIRPDVQGVRDALARGVQEYWAPPGDKILLTWGKTLSYHWIEWFLGPILVAGGIAALSWWAWRGLAPARMRLLPFAAVGLTVTLGYLITPQVGPDLPWATRRFVAVSIPLMFLAFGMVLDELRRLRPPLSQVVVAGVAVVCLIAPIRATLPLADTAVGRTTAQRFDQICALARTEPSAILVTPDLYLAQTVPIPLGQWCGLPVAGADAEVTAAQIRELQAGWADQGRRLLLLTTTPAGLVGVGGEATRIEGPPLRKPETTTDRRPQRIVDNQFLLEFPQPSGGRLPMWVVDPSVPVSTP